MKLRTLFVCAAIALTHCATASERSLLVRPIVNNQQKAADLEDQRVAEATPRVMTPEEKAALIQQKLRAVAQLQDEIQKLRAEAGIHQQIRVRVEMLEVSLTKLHKMETETAKDQKNHIDSLQALHKLLRTPAQGGDKLRPVQGESESAITLINKLKQQNIAKVLNRPTVVAESGRPASIFIGEEIPVPAPAASGTSADLQRCGTELEVVAHSLPGDTVRLEIRVKSCTRSGQPVPAINVLSCETCLTTKFGQPVVLGGSVSERIETVTTRTGKTHDEVNEVALIVVVTPETDGPIATAERDSSDTVR
jgi:type II secretory pathway component GspD/PulD (secretin)